MTKIGQFSRHTAESIWAGLFVIAIVYFNSYSLQAFEPDKLALMRGLVFLLVVAGGVVYAERMSPQWRKVFFNPFNTPLWLGVFFFLCMIASVFWSLAPSQSLWGWLRQQGADTQLFYLIFLLSVVLLTSALNQIERLIDITLIACVPMTLYAIVQAQQCDPLLTHRHWSDSSRPISTQALPTTVAAILALLTPFLLIRIGISLKNLNHYRNQPETMSAATPSDALDSKRVFSPLRIRIGISLLGTLLLHGAWQQGLQWGIFGSGVWLVCLTYGSKSPEIWKKRLQWGSYCTMLSLYVAALVVTNSRGPLLALAGAVLLMVLIFFAKQRWRLLLIGTVLFGIACATFIVYLNVSHGPWAEYYKQWGPLNRLGNLLDLASGQYRLKIMDAVWSATQVSNWHLCFGYGLETTTECLLPYLHPDLVYGSQLPDRVHHDLSEILLNVGLIGVTVYMAFIASIVGLALRGLGLIVSRTNWIVYSGCLLVGLTVGIVLALYRDASYTGLAINAGLYLGLATYIVGVGFTKPIKVTQSTQSTQGDVKDCGNTGWNRQQLLLVAAMSGVMCHWIETAFLFPTAATRLIFCLCAGIILVVSSKRLESVEAQPSVTPLKASAAQKKKGEATSLKIAEDKLNNETLADQSLMTMLWPAVCIITLFAYEIFGPLHFRDPHFEFYAASLIWSVWILVGVFCVAIFGCARSWKYLFSRLGLLGLCSAFITLVLIGVSGPENQDVVLVDLRWNVIAVFLLAGTLFFAGVLYYWQSRKSRDLPFSVRNAWPIYGIPFLIAIYIYIGWSGNTVKADMYKKLSNAHFETYKRSATLNAAQQQPLSLSQEQIAVFDKTLALAKLAAETNPHGAQLWLDMADLLTVRATWPADLALKKEYYAKAEDALNRASKLNPYSIRTLHQQTNFYWVEYNFYPDENERENALIKAEELALRAIELAPTLTLVQTQAAEILAKAGDVYFAAGKYEKAEIAYTKMLHLKKPFALFALGTTLHKLKRFEEAEMYLLKARDLNPSDWKINSNLTVLYKDWNNIPKAVKAAQDALLTAPPEKRLELEMFIKNSR